MLFVYVQEVGICDELQWWVFGEVQQGDFKVYIDLFVLFIGFFFKVVQFFEIFFNFEVYVCWMWICDIGYLCEVYWDMVFGKEGKVGWCCVVELVDQYVVKGGKVEDIVGCKCLCNVLMFDVGLLQIQKNGDVEKFLFISGDGLIEFGSWKLGYMVVDVIEFLCG